MITQRLFENVLVKPVEQGANKLYIVSGYATSAMAFHHMQFLRDKNKNIYTNLIVGMCSQDGLSESNHRGFQELMQVGFPGSFECSYLVGTPPVHSKIYSWFKDDTPVCAYTGSANYTQIAFSKAQREAMADCNPEQGLDYFKSLIPQTIYCTHSDAENLIQIYNDRYYERLRRERESAQQQEDVTPPVIQTLIGLPTVRVSLLDRSGNLPQRSGLNWGQRPELHREPNQAYIKLSSSVYNADFFPERKVHFTVLTDDGKVLICTRAQDNGKAIHTPHKNSLIGEYFRNRLGLPNGAAVTTDDLLLYGRTHVDFYKIDDETYYMDFSVPVNG